ncbi:hypothetical protein Tco_0833552 [Tanacetum coccineum]
MGMMGMASRGCDGVATDWSGGDDCLWWRWRVCNEVSRGSVGIRKIAFEMMIGVVRILGGRRGGVRRRWLAGGGRNLAGY